jgi:hypothetical protein
MSAFSSFVLLRLCSHVLLTIVSFYRAIVLPLENKTKAASVAVTDRDVKSLETIAGKFHDQGDAKWIVIRRTLRGHDDMP